MFDTIPLWVAKQKGVNRGEIVTVTTKWETKHGTEINLDGSRSAEQWVSENRMSALPLRLGQALFELPYANMGDCWVE